MIPVELGNWSKNYFKYRVSKWGIKIPSNNLHFPIFICDVSSLPFPLTSITIIFPKISPFFINENPQSALHNIEELLLSTIILMLCDFSPFNINGNNIFPLNFYFSLYISLLLYVTFLMPTTLLLFATSLSAYNSSSIFNFS